MIKRMRFAARPPDVPRDAFRDAWPGAVAAALDAPPGARPSRLAVCTPVPLAAPDAPYDAVGIEWFADAGHLRRFEEWLGTSGGRERLRPLDGLAESAASPVIVADESPLRGADWLDRRWAAGGARFKHMALAVRAAHLTPAEFAERWRAHAGRVRTAGSSAATAVPDAVRGCAYVQNHPRPRTPDSPDGEGEWAYDAVNEVYFDDLAGLRARVEWFRATGAGRGGDDLFGRSWFLAVREEVIGPTREPTRRSRCSAAPGSSAAPPGPARGPGPTP
ncbi:EthD domain-containing protein [Actinomadura sp. WMMB 499]|uniref:EthD domain-containing protein n=1 Tax=Actinomadura sp. WMMB 499 TaxID=1219491 RepID=UPI00159D57A3|nr:EthD domain-containing protein [Actinomadura sp. WMMB 499]